MNNALSSLPLLGLDPHSFRLVHEDEMEGGDLGAAWRHSDGSTCECPCECSETVEREEARGPPPDARA